MLHYLKILLVLIIHIIILFIIAPIIDHAFTTLHKDETNTEILVEITTQLLTVSVIWYLIKHYFFKPINVYLGLHKVQLVETTVEIVSAVILIGLQTNLLSKLEYITHEHPFRVFT